MRNIRRRQFLSSSIALLACPALGSDKTNEPVPTPIIKVGDSWTYRSTNYVREGTEEHETRVTYVSEKTILAISVLKSDRKEIETTWTPEWNSVVSYSGRVFRPSTELFRFPLRVGASYARKYDWLEPHNNFKGLVEGRVKIVEWETVEVPAGKFQAVRLESQFEIWGPSGNASRFWGTFSYAPDVGRWVKLKVEGPRPTVSEELLAFKLV